MRKTRTLIVALLAFWLVLGPAGGAWASGGGASCESMMSALPADDVPADRCCGDDEPRITSCAGVCAAASLGIAFIPPPVLRIDGGARAVASRYMRYASRAAPPDVAPPKALAS